MPMPQKRPQPGDRVQPRAMILEETMTRHKYWTNTDTTFLMNQVKEFELRDKKGFLKFMVSGKALCEYAAEDDLDGF